MDSQESARPNLRKKVLGRGLSSNTLPVGKSEPEQEGCCHPERIGRYLPAVRWLWGYSWRYLQGDLAAGAAVAALNISISISAAVVADTDSGLALRASIINCVVYSLLCSSPHVSFGSWSVMSQLLVVSVRRALGNEMLLEKIKVGASSGNWNHEEYEYWHTNLIIAYTFFIGLFQLSAGLLNLGNIFASFIPEALCSSLIAATAFTMAIGQLANMLGTSNRQLFALERNTTALEVELKVLPKDITDLFAGTFRWLKQITLLLKFHDQLNLVAGLISLISLIILVLNTNVFAKLINKYLKREINLPIELVLIIGVVCVSYWLELEQNYLVPMCGFIELEFGAPNWPNFRLIRELWIDTLTTSIISFTMVYVMAKNYANKLNYEIDCNQELMACGAGNLIGGLFDALPATASTARSSMQVQAGGKTQMASLIQCAFLCLFASMFGQFATHLPVCVMSTCLFYGFVRMLNRTVDVLYYWRVCKVDFCIWMVTFMSIVMLDLVTGFLYGFIFSISTMLYRAQNRRCYLLGCIEASDVYVPLVKYPVAKEIDGIKIFQFCGPIHYVCADLYERLLRHKTGVNVRSIMKSQSVEKFNLRDSGLPTHLILDFSMISYIDSSGIRLIKKIIEDHKKIGITVFIASPASHVAAVIKSEPSLWETHKDRFYITLADAVHCATIDPRPRAEKCISYS